MGSQSEERGIRIAIDVSILSSFQTDFKWISLT
jgi:hypothetical protein